jgi:hypothetical protein
MIQPTEDEKYQIVRNLINLTSNDKLQWNLFLPEFAVKPTLCVKAEATRLLFIFMCWNADMILLASDPTDHEIVIEIKHEALTELKDVIDQAQKESTEKKIREMIGWMMDPLAIEARPAPGDGFGQEDILSALRLETDPDSTAGLPNYALPKIEGENNWESGPCDCGCGGTGCHGKVSE